MNIQSVIAIYAGGPGSGPNAPCPQCGPHNFKEGDTVTLKPGAYVYHPKVGAKYNFKEGTKLKVTNVLPKVGSQEQMVSVEPIKEDKGLGGMVPYAKVSDLVMHTPVHEDALGKLPVWTKSWSRNPIDPAHKKLDIQPVPKSQVIMHTTTNDGASLTWVKTPETTEAEAKNLANEEHSLKGKFNLLTGVGVKDTDGNRVTRIYDTTRTPLESRSVPKGSTVYVSSKTAGGKITGIDVKEQNTGPYSQKVSTATFSYKNAAAAVGMLKQRYSISTTLKKLRGGG